MKTPTLKNPFSNFKDSLSFVLVLQLILGPVTLSMPSSLWAEEESAEAIQKRQEEERARQEAEALAQREAQVQDQNKQLESQAATSKDQMTKQVGVVDQDKKALESQNHTTARSLASEAESNNGGKNSGSNKQVNRHFYAGKIEYNPDRNHEGAGLRYVAHIATMCTAVWGLLLPLACFMTPSMLIFGIASASYIGMEVALSAAYQKGSNADATVDTEGAFDQQTSNILAAHKVTKRGENYAQSKAKILDAIVVLSGVAMAFAVMEAALCNAADSTVVGKALLQKMCKCRVSVSQYQGPQNDQEFDPMKALFPKTFYAAHTPKTSGQVELGVEQYFYAKFYEQTLTQTHNDTHAFFLMQEWLSLSATHQSIDLDSYRKVAQMENRSSVMGMGKILASVVKSAWNNFNLVSPAKASEKTSEQKTYCLNPDCTTKCIGAPCLETYGAQAMYECLDASCSQSCKGLGCKEEKNNATTAATTAPSLNNENTFNSDSGTTSVASTLNEREIEARAEFQKNSLRLSAEEDRKRIKDSNLSSEAKEARLSEIDKKLLSDTKQIDEKKKQELKNEGQIVAAATGTDSPQSEKELRDKRESAKKAVLENYNSKMAAITNNKTMSPDDKARKIGDLKREMSRELATIESKFKEEYTALRKSGRLPSTAVQDGDRGGTFLQKYLLYPLGIHTAADVAYVGSLGVVVLAEYAGLAGSPEGRIVLCMQLMTLFGTAAKYAKDQAGIFNRNARKYATALTELDRLAEAEIDKSNNIIRDGFKEQGLARAKTRADFLRTYKDPSFDGKYPCFQGEGRNLDSHCDCQKNNTCSKVEAPSASTFANFNVPPEMGFAEAAADGAKMANSISNGNFQQAQSIAGEISSKNALSKIRKFSDDKLSELNKSRVLAGKKALDVSGDADRLNQRLMGLAQQTLPQDSAFKSLFGDGSVSANDLAGKAGAGSESADQKAQDEALKAAEEKTAQYEAGANTDSALKKLDGEVTEDDFAEGAHGAGRGLASVGGLVSAPDNAESKFGPLGDPNDPHNPKNAYNPKSPYFKGVHGINQNPEEDIFDIISGRYTKSALPAFLKKKEHTGELQELPQ